MRLIAVGFNYKKTSLSLREALALDRERSIELGARLVAQEVVEECLVLSTCNRTEVYAIGPCVDGVREAIYQTLSEKTAVAPVELISASYYTADAEALRHLFRVASSLDAMVVGEAQVLGQFKAAYQTAAEYNTVGPYLHKACHAAFRAAKRVRTETQIAELPVSVGSLAVELAENAVGNLGDKTVLIIGAGEMSSLVANHLKERGATHLWIANRSHDSAEALGKAVSGIVVPFESWQVHMQTADIVVTSVFGGGLVTLADVQSASIERASQPLIIIDLAIPRNVEESVSKIPGVKLFNIDDLQELAEKNLAARKDAAEKAEKIVGDEAGTAFAELKHIKLAPLIGRLQEKCSNIMKGELDRLFSARPDFTNDDKELVARCAEAIVKKILHDPIKLSKEELARPGTNGSELTSTLLKIFRVGE